jgi:hypothetical protein
MTTDQRNTVNMFLAVRNYSKLNEETTKNIPKFGENYSTLQKTVDEIQLISEVQGVNKTGLTIDKNKLKKKLIALAVKSSNNIAIHARVNNNDTLFKEVSVNESALGRLPEVTLTERYRSSMTG